MNKKQKIQRRIFFASIILPFLTTLLLPARTVQAPSAGITAFSVIQADIIDEYLNYQEEQEKSKDVNFTLVIGTFNVKVCGYGKKVEEVAAQIVSTNADIVGLQEIDVGTGRVDGADLPALLKKYTKYRYSLFSKAISFSGGEYGTMILSKYPIINAYGYYLDVAENLERRVLTIAQIQIRGQIVNFVNVHMPYGSVSNKERTLADLKKVLDEKLADKEYIMVGDFNCDHTIIEEFFSTLRIANKSFITYPSKNKMIDNILCTRGAGMTSVKMYDTTSNDISDHNMLTAKITLNFPADNGTDTP